ncbi:MAG: T9SS type A sorting domain-containing protein, partial [Candidatus Kapaibacterium sp.]
LPLVVAGGQNLAAGSASRIRVQVRFAYRLLSPVGVSTSISGMTVSTSGDIISGNDRRLWVELSGGQLPDSGEVARLRCLVLLGDSDRTALDLDSVQVESPANRLWTVGLENGWLQVEGICRTGSDRLVELRDGLFLKGVYPNPVRGEAVVSFETLGSGSDVEVELYDSRGTSVGRVWRGSVVDGAHEVRFTGKDLNSGLYICEVRRGGIRQRIAFLLTQ